MAGEEWRSMSLSWGGSANEYLVRPSLEVGAGFLEEEMTFEVRSLNSRRSAVKNWSKDSSEGQHMGRWRPEEAIDSGF